MPSIAKGRPGLSAPQAVDGEVVSRVWQTEVWRLTPGLRWHHELAAEPEWNGAWQPLLLAWQLFGAWLVAKTEEAVVGTSSLAAVWSWRKLADPDL